MKRLLLLGGSAQQVPAIKYANEQGYYTILCDYLSDNPGQHVANKFYNESTTDLDSVLKIATNEKIDGILAYASDPAAPTAAFVAEKLGLPTNTYNAVTTLAFKNKFRNFLQKNNFNCPRAMSFYSYEEANKNISKFTFPVMIKPIDSSGSKGVSKVLNIDDFENLFNYAMDNSRLKEIIVEEFIEQDHSYMVGGDCFVINGKVSYWGLLNCHRSHKVNPLVPVGKSYPLVLSEDRTLKIKKEIQRLVKLLDIKFGGFNVEIMVDSEDRVFIIEMGPRNGGNMIPDFLQEINGVNLIEASVETAIDSKYPAISFHENDGFYGSYNIHTEKNGFLDDIIYKNGIENCIIKKIIYKQKNDSVNYFNSSNKVIGIIFLKFENQQEQLNFFNNPEKWIEIIVK